LSSNEVVEEDGRNYLVRDAAKKLRAASEATVRAPAALA